MKKFIYIVTIFSFSLGLNSNAQNKQYSWYGIPEQSNLEATANFTISEVYKKAAVSPKSLQESKASKVTPVKNVVLEEGTGTWCSWCPGGTYTGDLLTEEYDNVFVIAVHGSDVMENTPHVDGASISAYPSANIDRNVMGSYIENWFGDVEDALEDPYVAGIEVSTTYNETTMEVSVEVSASFYEDISGDYRLGGVLLENGVTGPSPDYDQSNSYSGGGNGNMGGFESLPGPVPANMIAYNHVSRQLLGDYNGQEGSLPSNISTGETHSYTFSYTIPEDWDPDQVYVIAWLITPSEKLDNAGKSSYLTGGDNAKPVFISEPVTVAYINNEFIYSIFTHDPDESELEIEAVNIPGWLTISETTTLGHIHNSAVLSGTPTEAGSYDVTLSITDGEWTIDQSFEIIVQEALEGAWELIGTQGFTNGDSYTQDMAIDDEGTCYVITIDESTLNVFRKEIDGDWESLELNEPLGGYGQIEIASDGTPYIAYCYDWSNVYVKKYNGSSWEQVGGSPASGVQIGLALDSEDNPYIALQDGGNGYEGWAYKYDGSAWTELGGTSYSGSGTPGVWNNIIIDAEDNAFVLWGDFSYSGTASYVSKYDGSSWTIVGDEAISEQYVYYYQTFVLDEDGNIYAAFPDWTTQYLETVMCDGSEWSSIGSDLVGGAVEYCDMSITDAGDPIVTFLDITYSNTISAMKYNGSGWSFQGPQGFSGTGGSFPKIDVLGETPYICYADVPLGEKATVMAYMVANTATISANPSSVEFDTTAVGQVSDVIVMISNLGEVALQVTDVNSTSSFFTAGETSFTVEPGGTYELTLSFEPLNELWYESEIILQSNDPVNAELSIPVSGYGDYGLGIENPKMNPVVVSPNPASDKFLINGDFEMERVKMMDYSGKIVMDQELSGSQNEILTTGLKSGIYIVKIFSDKDVVTQKIVIQK